MMELDDEDIEISSGKTRLVTKTNFGNKEHESTLEFDSKNIPERASAEMYDAIFKNARKCGTLTKQDRAQIDLDFAKFLGSSKSQNNSKSTTKKSKQDSKNPLKNSKSKKSSRNKSDKVPLNLSQDSEDLLKQCDEILNWDSANSATDTQSLSEVTSNYASSVFFKPFTSPSKNKPTSTMMGSAIVEIDSDEDENFVISSPSPVDKNGDGEMIMCHYTLQAKKSLLRIYENQKIADVREMIVQKSGLINGRMDMYHGDFTELEDDKTVKFYGIKSRDEIDCYFKTQTDRELYVAGFQSVLRFKLQTADRRGRDNVYVYVKKTDKMRIVRDQYAKELKIEPEKVKLRFDGDPICLDSIPEACDLDGDECLDVVISE